MRQNEIMIQQVVDTKKNLLKGKISEVAFVSTLKKIVDLYFEKDFPREENYAHQMLTKFRDYVKDIKPNETNWLIWQVHSDLHIRVYLPGGISREMDRLIKEYFEEPKGRG